MGRKSKNQIINEKLMEFPTSHAQLIFDRFGVVAETHFNIFTMSHVTTLPEDIDAGAAHEIHRFSEAYVMGYVAARDLALNLIQK